MEFKLSTELKMLLNTVREFGKKIEKFQINQDMIAQMASEIMDSAHFMLCRASWEKLKGT